VLAQVVLVPLDSETDDFEILGVVEDVRMDVWESISALPNYTSRMENDNTRDAGVILILGEIAHEIIAQKDLITTIFQAGTAAVGALTKHGNVKKIELTLDGDSISIEDADRATVQKLINIFESRYPETFNRITSSSSIQVLGMVSKTKKSSHR